MSSLERKAEAREALLQFFMEMVEKGYRCFISATDLVGSVYGIVVLENTVMDISLEYFGGWNYSLNYKPSKGNGSGCRCNDIALNDLSYETLRVHEKGCVEFARKLKAEMYPTTEACLKYTLEHYKGIYEEVTL